jgi:hypothetical protein
VGEPEPAARRGRALAAASLFLPDLGDDSGEDSVVAFLVPARLDTRQQPLDTALT